MAKRIKDSTALTVRCRTERCDCSRNSSNVVSTVLNTWCAVEWTNLSTVVVNKWNGMVGGDLWCVFCTVLYVKWSEF